ncbi:hypothetical protein BH20ACT9_BH20ACT9_00420 [soil metagenome]
MDTYVDRVPDLERPAADLIDAGLGRGEDRWLSNLAVTEEREAGAPGGIRTPDLVIRSCRRPVQGRSSVAVFANHRPGGFGWVCFRAFVWVTLWVRTSRLRTAAPWLRLPVPRERHDGGRRLTKPMSSKPEMSWHSAGRPDGCCPTGGSSVALSPSPRSSRRVAASSEPSAWSPGACWKTSPSSATIDERGRLVAETNARRISANLGLSRNTVQKYLGRLRQFGFVFHEELRHDDTGRYEVSRYVIDPAACIERFTATPPPTPIDRPPASLSVEVADAGNLQTAVATVRHESHWPWLWRRASGRCASGCGQRSRGPPL